MCQIGPEFTIHLSCNCFPLLKLITTSLSKASLSVEVLATQPYEVNT